MKNAISVHTLNFKAYFEALSPPLAQTGTVLDTLNVAVKKNTLGFKCEKINI